MYHNDEVKKSFGIQAEKFAVYHMSKAEYTDYLIQKINALGTETALEVAAGTCICGRALAPYVKSIECLDLTDAMLTEGKKLANEAKLTNIFFTVGDAEKLPYNEESFDLVITRLSLHHFSNPSVPFAEMQRVLKTGGKLVVWDMEATEEALRDINDSIERMRDPSHTRILSREEFEELFTENFDIVTEETTLVSVNLQSWMNLTDTPNHVQKRIKSLMTDDLSDGKKTGFNPYIKDSEIFFDHRWQLMIGIKR